jgi:hypothetical protein
MTPLLAALAAASPTEADRLMRDAVQALLAWQADASARPIDTLTPPDALAEAAALQAFFDRWAVRQPERSWTEAERAGWSLVIRRLLSLASQPPQAASQPNPALAGWRLSPEGQVHLPAGEPLRSGFGRDLAALLRPAELGWDEALQLDWAVRYWEAVRKAGQLDEELAADFGEAWRRLEWAGLQQHLTLLGQGHAEERRLLAYAAQVSARYVELAPLKRMLEILHPEMFDLGFALR